MVAHILGFYLSVWALLGGFPVKENHFRVDDLGYIYTLGRQSVKKFNREGVLLYVYSRMDLGVIAQLDVSDPLRPLIFFPETGTMVILDNTLSEQRVLRLWDAGYGMPEWVASGVNQEFWVFDALNKEVFRIDEGMSRRMSTGYLPATTGHNIDIVGMAERHEQLLIADRKYGIWIFDRFGTLVRKVPIKNLLALRTHASGMTLVTDDGYFWMRYNDLLPVKVELPALSKAEVMSNGTADSTTIQADINSRNIYILREGRLQIYAR